MPISEDVHTQVLTVAQMRAAEQALIDRGETIADLMQRAGAGAAQMIWRVAAGRSVTVMCGPGNNGGDGYVIAQDLHARGLDVAVIASIEPSTPAAKAARGAYEGRMAEGGRRAAIFVDCLFGSGLNRPLSDDLADAISARVRSHEMAIAIDLPSNVSSDDGAMLGDVPQYDLTLALGAWKHAHHLMPAMGAMGGKRLIPIGIGAVDGAAHMAETLRISPPARDAHKYSRGFLAVVGGAMSGAAILSAEAAMHGGAGYVKLLAPHSHPAAPADLVIDERNLDEALRDDRFDAILVGPGLKRDPEARSRLSCALSQGKPLVLDADALILLERGDTGGRDPSLIVTPHEGELDRLEKTFGLAGDGSKPRRTAALAQAMDAVVVAKGPDTVIAAPDGRLTFAGEASPWLSTAGTGDVLAGLIASRLATGASALDAAVQAVQLHARAARLAGPAFTASQLARAVPEAFGEML